MSERPFDLTQTIGKCGIFQVFLTLTTEGITSSCVWGFLIMAYGSYNPGWICMDQEIHDVLVLNSSNTHSSNPSRTDNITKEWNLDCSIKKRCKNLIFNSKSSTVVTEWDLSCGLAWVPSIIISIEMAGAFIGCFLGGQIGDKFGRKTTIYGNLAFYTFINILAIFSKSWQMYACLLFFVGITVGGLISSSPTFPLEFVNGWWRGVIVSVPVWSVGFIIFTLTAWSLRNWWQLHAIAAAVSGAVFLTVFWMPESVRWLTVSGKVDKAKEVVAKIARINKHSSPDTRIIDKMAMEEKTRMGEHNYTYLDLFRITALRALSIKLGFIWLTMSFVYFSVTFGIRTLSGNFFLNLFLSSLLEIPGVLVVAPTANYFGRRNSALGFFSVVVIGCSGLVLMSFVASGNLRDMSILCLALFCKMTIVGAWAMFTLYTSEVVPTVVRNISLGYLNAVARVAAIISPFIIPNDPDKIFVGYLVLGILGIVSSGLIWSLPETKGMALKDATYYEAVTEKNLKSEASSVKTIDDQLMA